MSEYSNIIKYVLNCQKSASALVSLGQSWVGRDGVGTTHPFPQHPIHPTNIQIES